MVTCGLTFIDMRPGRIVVKLESGSRILRHCDEIRNFQFELEPQLATHRGQLAIRPENLQQIVATWLATTVPQYLHMDVH